jgi:hypothetical protein
LFQEIHLKLWIIKEHDISARKPIKTGEGKKKKRKHGKDSVLGETSG